MEVAYGLNVGDAVCANRYAAAANLISGGDIQDLDDVSSLKPSVDLAQLSIVARVEYGSGGARFDYVATADPRTRLNARVVQNAAAYLSLGDRREQQVEGDKEIERMGEFTMIPT